MSEQTTIERPITARIVQAVADQTNSPPVDLPPLYNYIDPDSLESLIESQNPQNRIEIEFSYEEYLVTISSKNDNKRIHVTER